MKITFKTEVHDDSFYRTFETHIVLDGDEELFRGSEGMEPEDALFHRELPDPFDCEILIRRVIKAVKDGEEVTIEYEGVEEDD